MPSYPEQAGAMMTWNAGVPTSRRAGLTIACPYRLRTSHATTLNVTLAIGFQNSCVTNPDPQAIPPASVAIAAEPAPGQRTPVHVRAGKSATAQVRAVAPPSTPQAIVHSARC